MPFLSYQASPADAVRNAGRFLAEAGVAAVKVEGGRRVLPSVEAILAADIPVMGHVGLTPQSFRKFGGFKVQGREADSAARDSRGRARPGRGRLFRDRARMRSRVARREITGELSIPTIGIGAGPQCDGQVLVFHDVVGLSRDFRPKFVRRYAELTTVIGDAARAFAQDVREGAFPSPEESFAASPRPCGGCTDAALSLGAR